jgi:hypothetical protein
MIDNARKLGVALEDIDIWSSHTAISITRAAWTP